MYKVVAAILFGLALSVGAGAAFAAETADEAQAPACKRAEINPVTGHVLCIDPLGAPVEAPPAAEAPPCKPDQRKDEAWTWGPTCNETPEG